jgi:hypothetical protein
MRSEAVGGSSPARPTTGCLEHIRLSALILPYFSTLKAIFCPSQRDSLPYTTILRTHLYPIFPPYTNYPSLSSPHSPYHTVTWPAT